MQKRQRDKVPIVFLCAVQRHTQIPHESIDSLAAESRCEDDAAAGADRAPPRRLSVVGCHRPASRGWVVRSRRVSLASADAPDC